MRTQADHIAERGHVKLEATRMRLGSLKIEMLQERKRHLSRSSPARGR
jgi:hypothetical protein